MQTFSNIFEEIFSKHSQPLSFHIPVSIKELKLFTENVCWETCKKLNHQEHSTSNSEWSKSGSEISSQKESENIDEKVDEENDPIGLNSLLHTFHILQTVGQGNFGKVFKAENKFDRRVFAIKQIKITPTEDLKKVLQEVENLSKVGKHKNIVRYIDCFLVHEEVDGDAPNNSLTDDSTSSTHTMSNHSDSSSFLNFDSNASSLQQVGWTSETSSISSCKSSKANSEHFSPKCSKHLLTCICIKMEFCDFTLDQLLQSLSDKKENYTDIHKLFENIQSFVNFKEDRANSKFGAFCPLFIISQLLEGLIFIHDLGIVHRDLKPANIFIMQNGKVKIGDFGLSKDLTKECGLSKLYAAGTKFYIAPEFLHQRSVRTSDIFLPSTDMFSLGMVIIKILCSLILDESELFRLNDKLRSNHKRELRLLMKRENIGQIALGTTKGNLNISNRTNFQLLLMDFFNDLLLSLLDHNPHNRLTATQAKYKADVIFSEIFFGNDFCCGDFRL